MKVIRDLLVSLGAITIVLAVGFVFARPAFRVPLGSSSSKVQVTVYCLSPWKQWTGGRRRDFGGVDSFQVPGNGFVQPDSGRCPAATARDEHVAEGLAVAGLAAILGTLLVGRSARDAHEGAPPNPERGSRGVAGRS